MPARTKQTARKSTINKKVKKRLVYDSDDYTSSDSDSESDYSSDSESDYSSDSSVDSEELPIQVELEPEFKDVDFEEKLLSAVEINLSTNIMRHTDSYEQKYINRYTLAKKLRKKPLLSTRRWEVVRYFVLGTKYVYLDNVKNYDGLLVDDVRVLLENRDKELNVKQCEINTWRAKWEAMENKFRWAMRKAFQHGFRYGN